MATFNVPVYDTPVTQNRQFQPYSMTQPVQNPNFTQQSPNSPAVGFYTSTPQNINSVMQPMVNPYSDTNCKLDDLTQKVNMIFDKMSTLDELSNKISTFDRAVQNLFKTVEKVSKRVDDVEQGMNFINEKFEDAKKDVSDVKGVCAGIREDADSANDAIFRLQKDLDELYTRHIDLQTRSMRENLIFTGIPMHDKFEESETTEKVLEKFMTEQLKLCRIAEYDRAHRFETKLDDCDVINCDEFIFSFKNRHKITSHRSGGIALGYRKCLDKCIKTFDTECKFVYWFSVDKKVFDLDENIVFGIVYIPPVNTNYTSEEAFNEIDVEFQRFSQNSKYIVLLGDFNSRTANLSDFYDENSDDEFIVQHFTDQFDYTDVHILDNLKIPRERNSPDNVVNGFGRKLLDFCKSNKVFILNGRVGQDVNAKPTSRNNSVIDYIVCTSHFLQFVSNFEIGEFSKLFSDVHSPLSLHIDCQSLIKNNEIENHSVQQNMIGKWKMEKINEYRKNIDTDKVDCVISKLNTYNDKENISKNDMNNLVHEVSDILIDSAKLTFGTNVYAKTMLSNSKKQNNKQWYDKDCNKAKKELRKSQRLYKKSGSTIDTPKLNVSHKIRVEKSEAHSQKLNRSKT
ncbi:Hypothetical predicted protein [Mytilus galloprovincialis]|uniref:Endonuclease/exonuclease/phosphatase domain-containing protein n=1 Tax=Mytilus galloprovincialis TaxID=29158 RepID=A0A8B6EWA1_MYTGA|nr:Hypothetical predicted protein [Mytilus galloprovincialis]